MVESKFYNFSKTFPSNSTPSRSFSIRKRAEPREHRHGRVPRSRAHALPVIFPPRVTYTRLEPDVLGGMHFRYRRRCTKNWARRPPWNATPANVVSRLRSGTFSLSRRQVSVRASSFKGPVPSSHTARV